MQAKDRIVGLRRIKAGELIDHTANWRRHPKAQRDALEAILESVGYVGALIARETDAGLELIDGHLRKETTPGQEVPVLVVDIDETEARQVLATYDPIGQMADIHKATFRIPRIRRGHREGCDVGRTKRRRHTQGDTGKHLPTVRPSKEFVPLGVA